MKAEMTFSIDTHGETIELEDYGIEEGRNWSDLTEDEKNTIRDGLTEQMIIECCGADYE